MNRPEGYSVSARRYPRRLRIVASAVLSAFLAVTLLTTVLSLGAYCLTTWGGNPLG